MRISWNYSAFLLLLSILVISVNSGIPRPRGVPLLSASLYHPVNDNKWVCLDGIKTIKFIQINDDYCDCEDGSDEPGTSACPNGIFHCSNLGYRSKDLPSSRVNDGICDCCDGSDEYEEGMPNCSNICEKLGRAELEQRKSEAELHKRGSKKRYELINKGTQLKSERLTKRNELEQRRAEQEVLKKEKEELKRHAEALESDALEVYREQQREQDAAIANKAQTEQGPESMRLEAESSFQRYDSNKDGFVEITELQVDMTLDRDRNGVVTVEEAKYFLDDRDRIDLEAFFMLSWPRIKTMKMVQEGIFKPPIDYSMEKEEAVIEANEKQPLVEGAEVDANTEDDSEHGDEHEMEEEDYEEEESESDVGVGSAVPENTTDPTDYDPETQHLVELANEARNAHAEVERQIRELEQEIKEIDHLNAKDYGINEEYASLDGECFTFEDREYVYTLCPFDRSSQKQRSGGAETTIGRWDQWIGDDGDKYRKQKYSHGASCWNGPQRSAIVEFKCALEEKITSVTEPNRCEYFFTFETPAACDGIDHTPEEESLHDEL